MESLFTYVKRFDMQDHPFRDFAHLNDANFDISEVLIPRLPNGKPPDVSADNFLTLYCLQDER
ncbi:MAG TPA: hypothetical protein VK999_06040 [Methylotenera sp.]|nr:hypothetical protein [Methylotenera sp.]